MAHSGPAPALRSPGTRRHGSALGWSPWGHMGQRESTRPPSWPRWPPPLVGAPVPGQLPLCCQPLAYLPFSSPQVKHDGRAPAPPHCIANRCGCVSVWLFKCVTQGRYRTMSFYTAIWATEVRAAQVAQTECFPPRLQSYHVSPSSCPCTLLAEVQQLRGQRCEALGTQTGKQDRPRLVRALKGHHRSPGAPGLLAGAGT